MKYKIGTYIKVIQSSIHKDRIGRILESHSTKVPMTNKVEFFYTVKLISAKGEEIVVPHDFIEVYEDEDHVKCTCGGEFLVIEHHYDWCSKGGRDEQNN